MTDISLMIRKKNIILFVRLKSFISEKIKNEGF